MADIVTFMKDMVCFPMSSWKMAFSGIGWIFQFVQTGFPFLP